MPEVQIKLPHHEYEVTIEPGSLGRLGSLIREVLPKATRATLITDEGVEPHYARPVAKAMDADGLETVVAVMPCGEKKKTLGTVRNLYEVLLENRMERGEPVVALGGGICGDTAGYVAASYLRGVPFVQCPTSLLAMVDASVGGKVGVNVPQGKNLIGAFHQPTRVVIDPEVLETLPQRELVCGLAECVKHGIIRDEELFRWTQGHAADILAKDMDVLVELITRNVKIKAAVVMEDEREAGVRAHLNLGHTFAHAIEATARFGTKYKHGEAVSLGMVAAAKLAAERGMCGSSVVSRTIEALQAVGLPTTADQLAPTKMLINAMMLDKKVQSGRIRLVLPASIGEVKIVNDASLDEIAKAWDSLREG